MRHPLSALGRLRPSSLVAAAAAAAAAVLAACQVFEAPPASHIGLWPDAAGATHNNDLKTLLEDGWQSYLSAHPEFASYLGDSRYNGKLTDITPEIKAARQTELWKLQGRSQALERGRLDAEDALSLELFDLQIREELDELSWSMEEWTADPLGGPQSQLLARAVDQPASTDAERAQLLERWSGIALVIRRQGEALLRGRSRGLVAPAALVEKTIAQLDGILNTGYWDSPLVVAAAAGGHWVELEPEQTLAAIASAEYGDARRQESLRRINQRLLTGELRALGTRVLIPAVDDPLTPDARGAFLGAVIDRIELEIYPALAGYRALLAKEIQPGARSDDKPGLIWLPGGKALYEALARKHTTLAKTPQEIHQFGLGRVQKINQQMVELGRQLFGVSSLAALRARTGSDPALHFANAEEIVATAKDALRRAEVAAPKFLKDMPASRCEVVEIPRHEAPTSTTAYYQPPSIERGIPGRYYVNTYQPETRPRFEAEALAFHEAVPGHHTQISFAAENSALPAFRRHLGATAFVEGWALYAEELADEFKLYSSDLMRLGKLSYQAWRASRLVVDTGLHNDGWTRDQALTFLQEHTLLSPENVANEVDRYIAWPGQALAYELGSEEIQRLRRSAQTLLGNKFSLPDFHRELLRHGALPLAALGGQIDRWIADRK